MTKEEKDLCFEPKLNNKKKDDIQDLQNILSNLSIKVCEPEIEKNEIDDEDSKTSEKLNEEKEVHYNDAKDVTDESSDFATSDDDNEGDNDDGDESEENNVSREDENSGEPDKDGNNITYLCRGRKYDNLNRCNRYSPLKTQSNQQNHYKNNSYTSLSRSSYSDPVFDVINLDQCSTNEVAPQGYGFQQSASLYSNVDSPTNSSHLSMQPAHTFGSAAFYENNFPTNLNQNGFCGYETELKEDAWSEAPSHFPHSPPLYLEGKACGTPYSPLSPPLSLSSRSKDGQDSSQIGTLRENDNLKDSEDLINIINTINRTSKNEPEPKVIPEEEFLILKNVLEGKEDSIRDEMSIYLNGDNFQAPFPSLPNSPLPDFPYEEPLTPPKSVPQSQDASSYGSRSPSSDYGQNNDLGSYSSEERLAEDMLNGIDEINPEELNIYLDKETNNNEACYARSVIESHCSPTNLDHVLRKLSSISPRVICEKDEEGDTGLMIVYSKSEGSPWFLENIFCLQERALKIKVCCDHPLGKAKKCKRCGSNDPSKFYTPLSLKNKNGDTALSCAVKMDHSEMVIKYLVQGILQCHEDFRRVFDDKGRAMLADLAYKSPCLLEYLYD